MTKLCIEITSSLTEKNKIIMSDAIHSILRDEPIEVFISNYDVFHNVYDYIYVDKESEEYDGRVEKKIHIFTSDYGYELPITMILNLFDENLYVKMTTKRDVVDTYSLLEYMFRKIEFSDNLNIQIKSIN